MAAYYNEFDPKAAAWLRELIKEGLIADGYVDERSITEVRADDLMGFTQCHFFAGIGGWSYALRLAGIPDDYPVWTGSCPCQPFSTAGKQNGKEDDRHLLPIFTRLIAEVRPITVFGEQVEGAVKHGWLDDLQADLEREGYSVGAAVLGAHSVGSFHQRQRLYWVAYADSKRQFGVNPLLWAENKRRNGEEEIFKTTWGGEDGGMANPKSDRCRKDGYSYTGSVQRKDRHEEPEIRFVASREWSRPDWLYCRDNKYRPIKPGLEPLANGIPARVVRLRGYGNAIVPQVAAEFIGAFYDIRHVAQ